MLHSTVTVPEQELVPEPVWEYFDSRGENFKKVLFPEPEIIPEPVQHVFII